MAKYRKKLVVVEAVQFDGNNYQEIFDFTEFVSFKGGDGLGVLLRTPSGFVSVRKGDWVIKEPGPSHCKPDIFEQTYEIVEDKQ